MEISPPWGSIPVEAYILQNWDTSSSTAPTDQLRHLVRLYIGAGYHDPLLPSPLLHLTEKLIFGGQIRPTGKFNHNLAALAYPFSKSGGDRAWSPTGQIGCIWLRTDYSAESEGAHESLLENVDLFNTLDDEDRLLDDEDLYDFGQEWQKVLDLMPELVVSTDASNWHSSLTLLTEAEDELDKAKAYLAGGDIQGAPVELIEGMRTVLPADKAGESVLQILRSKVHKTCVVNYILVEDSEALETQQLLLIFLDAHGRVVRSSRVPPDQAEQMGGF
ncbi:hypothetical protein CJF30_00009297 [Rutstroemia sp. NJR-2017a BBW]|nr:hypothetical protein CJF30_00009297 [Rutstroemia sp. NJR-2017a BBW]